MVHRIKMQRMTAMFMVFILLIVFIGGCGNAGDKNGAGDNSQGGNGERGTASSEAMGRYVEEVTDLSDKISGSGNKLYQLANGNLVITDRIQNFVKTGDNGAVWMTDSRRWRSKMMEEGTYIMSMAVGADNTVALIYQADEENEDIAGNTAEDKAGEEAEGKAEEVEGTEKDEAEEEVENTSGDKTEDKADTSEAPEIILNPKLLIIKPDNTEIPIEIALTEDDAYLDQVYIADNDRIFVTTRGTSNLYEVKEDGSSELFLMIEEGHADLIQFQGNLMVIDGYGYGGLLLYDMEKKEYIEDEVLSDFVEENYKDRGRKSIDSYDLFFFFGEEDIIYLAGEKGLYRHVIGGSVMEQLIDGKLCSLGNPSYQIQGMLALENNEFLAVFEGGKIIHYTYDPDISTIPGETLKVYALEDNETIRQAINLYQSQNPEVYIEFEYGMGGDNSVTREDALKNLNTRIVSGEGPDVLVLDNMPIDSYIEKGLLLELSPILESMEGDAELFGNIVGAMKNGDGVYEIPCEVRLPIMMVDKKYASQINDLEDIADMVETVRAENPKDDLLGLCSEKSILRLFSMTSVPAWLMDDGSINREEVQEFLEFSKRIYDAQMDGIADSAVERYRQVAEDHELYNGVASFDDSDYVRIAGRNELNYVGGYMELMFGALSCLDITSIQKTSGFENIEWMPMKGQSDNVFWAKTLLGINAASEKAELAEDFLRLCLGKENQTYLYTSKASLPVNKAAFDEKFTLPESEVDSSGMYGSVATESNDGTKIVLVYYWPDEEEIARYQQYMEAVDTVYYENSVLEDAVYEAGISYIQGTQSLEEAVNAIEKKVSIYMAE